MHVLSEKYYMERKFTQDLFVSALFLDPGDPCRNMAEHFIAGNRRLTDECLILRSLFREMSAHQIQPDQERVNRILEVSKS